MTDVSYYDHLNDPLHDLTIKRLTPLVQRALNRPQAEITQWSRNALRGIGGGVGGNQVVLLNGEAKDGEAIYPWRLVLKIIQAQPIDKPTGSHYWLREAEVYRSGFANTLKGKLFAPECYVVDFIDDSACWLWLAFVEDTAGERWPVERFEMAARHLGEFNGAYMTGEKLPIYPWMSEDWHRDNLEQVAPLVNRFKTAMSHRLYQRGYTENTHAHILEMWESRDKYLKALAGIPKTICHYDAFRRNLIAHHDTTAAIDWTFVGPGPVGADLAAMIWVSFVFNNISADGVKQLHETALSHYMAGLRDAGWNGNEAEVRLGYLASFPIRVAISAGYDTLLLMDDSRHSYFQGIVGCTIEEYMDHVAAVQPIIRQISLEANDAMGI